MNEFFDKLRQLITEHASADALIQHLELYKSKYAFMEQERDSLKLENANLKKENQHLASVVDDYKKKNEDLERRLKQGRSVNLPYNGPRATGGNMQ